MGLDVYLHQITGRTYKEYQDGKNQVYVFVLDKSWEDRISDLKKDTYYESDGGVRVTGYNYGTHSKFRQTLADVAHSGMYWGKVAGGDFYQFIDFADNEGAITWTTAAKLARDFRKHEAAYLEKFKDNDWMCTIYNDWMNGFEKCAVEKGVIEYC